MLIAPCSQTGVGGCTGAIAFAPPGGIVTRTRYAVGSQRDPDSPGPGTSGLKRALALAKPPGRRTTRTAVSAPRFSAVTRVGSFRPFRPMSCSAGRPDEACDARPVAHPKRVAHVAGAAAAANDREARRELGAAARRSLGGHSSGRRRCERREEGDCEPDPHISSVMTGPSQNLL